MHNVIKRSTSAISSAIGRQNMWFAVNESVNPTATSDWYNGYKSSESGYYTIYIHKASGGPVIYSTFSDLELVETVQKLGANVYFLPNALNWIASQPDMICVNKNYQSIATNGQVLLVDGDFTPSYPLTGYSWYDLSSVPIKADGVLTNGVSFNYNYRAMSFDGIDDYVNLGNTSSLGTTGDMTICALVYFNNFTNYNGIIAKTTNTGFPAPYDYYTSQGSGTLAFLRGNGSVYGVSYSTSAPATQRWQFVAVTMSGSGVTHYLNNNINGTGSIVTSISNGANNAIIGSRTDGATKMNGFIRSVQVYSRSLTTAEILRNYYMGNIITDGLNYFLDAGNLVCSSYANTSVYNLVGGSLIGTLVNGAYSSVSAGGCWFFDGANDALTLNSSISLGGSNSWTVSMWVRPIAFSSGFGSLLSTNNGAGPVLTSFGVTDGYISYQNYTGTWLYASGNTKLYPTGTNWYYLTWANSENKMTMYVNGIADSDEFVSTGGSVNSIGSNWYESFLGFIASVEIYGVRLTEEQIQRNYDEQVTRFKT